MQSKQRAAGAEYLPDREGSGNGSLVSILEGMPWRSLNEYFLRVDSMHI